MTKKINSWLDYEHMIEDEKNLTDFKDTYIYNLQSENGYLNTSNPEQNLIHFKMLDENKRKINNLRAENIQLKKSASNWVALKKYITDYRIQHTSIAVPCVALPCNDLLEIMDKIENGQLQNID